MLLVSFKLKKLRGHDEEKQNTARKSHATGILTLGKKLQCSENEKRTTPQDTLRHILELTMNRDEIFNLIYSSSKEQVNFLYP